MLKQLAIGALSAEGLNVLFPSIARRHDRNRFTAPLAREEFFQRYRPESDIQRSQSLNRQAIRFASKILVQGIPKNPVIGCGIGKQSHRRMKFEIVRGAKNLVN